MINLGTVFDYKISKQIDFVSDYQLKLASEESGKALHQLKLALEVLLGQHLFDLQPKNDNYTHLVAVARRFDHF